MLRYLADPKGFGGLCYCPSCAGRPASRHFQPCDRLEGWRADAARQEPPDSRIVADGARMIAGRPAVAG